MNKADAAPYVRISSNGGPDPSPLLCALAHVAARKLSDGSMIAGRCVNASWIVARVLRRLGQPATPMSVEALATNAKTLELLEKHGSLPRTAREGKAWRKAGAWMVQIDTADASDPNDDGLRGHVVVLSDGWIIDAAASQFHRPQHRIVAPEVLLLRAPDDFAAGGIAAEAKGDQGDAIAYVARPDDVRFTRAPGFTAHNLNLASADYIEQAVRALLAASPEITP